MANPIVQKISVELENLQKEMDRFKKTTDYLNGAKQLLVNAVTAIHHSDKNLAEKAQELQNTFIVLNELNESMTQFLTRIDSIDFPERLDRIEGTVRETIVVLDETRQSTLAEIQTASQTITEADFAGKFRELQTAISSTVASSDKLVNKIESQQIPQKISSSEATIVAELNAVQKALETSLKEQIKGLEVQLNSIESEIKKAKDQQKATESSVKAEVVEHFESLYQALEKNQKKQLRNSIITWGLLFFGGVIIMYLKFF